MAAQLSAARVAVLVGDFDRRPAYAGLAAALRRRRRRRPDPGRHPPAQRARAGPRPRRLPDHRDPGLRGAPRAWVRRGAARLRHLRPAARWPRAHPRPRARAPRCGRRLGHRPQLRGRLRPARPRRGVRRRGRRAAGVPLRPRLLPRRAARAPGPARRRLHAGAGCRPTPSRSWSPRARSPPPPWPPAPRSDPATASWWSRRATPTRRRASWRRSPACSRARRRGRLGPRPAPQPTARATPRGLPRARLPEPHRPPDDRSRARRDRAPPWPRSGTVAVVDETHQALALEGQRMPRPLAATIAEAGGEALTVGGAARRSGAVCGSGGCAPRGPGWRR